MQKVLIEKLHRYINDNNPNLPTTLQQEDDVNGYLRKQLTVIDLLVNGLLASHIPP